jgi:hypothetical protein
VENSSYCANNLRGRWGIEYLKVDEWQAQNYVVLASWTASISRNAWSLRKHGMEKDDATWSKFMQRK